VVQNDKYFLGNPRAICLLAMTQGYREWTNSTFSVTSGLLVFVETKPLSAINKINTCVYCETIVPEDVYRFD